MMILVTAATQPEQARGPFVRMAEGGAQLPQEKGTYGDRSWPGETAGSLGDPCVLFWGGGGGREVAELKPSSGEIAEPLPAPLALSAGQPEGSSRSLCGQSGFPTCVVHLKNHCISGHVSQ